MSHRVKVFSIVSEAEVDIFLEFPCFLYDPRSIGNLISGSSAFSKSSLYIWEFAAHLLLKPFLKDFQHKLCNVKWVQLHSRLNILWLCPSLEVEWKLTFSSLVVSAEFFQNAVILSVAL